MLHVRIGISDPKSWEHNYPHLTEKLWCLGFHAAFRVVHSLSNYDLRAQLQYSWIFSLSLSLSLSPSLFMLFLYFCFRVVMAVEDWSHPDHLPLQRVWLSLVNLLLLMRQQFRVQQRSHQQRSRQLQRQSAFPLCLSARMRWNWEWL